MPGIIIEFNLKSSLVLQWNIYARLYFSKFRACTVMLPSLPIPKNSSLNFCPSLELWLESKIRKKYSKSNFKFIHLCKTVKLSENVHVICAAHLYVLALDGFCLLYDIFISCRRKVMKLRNPNLTRLRVTTFVSYSFPICLVF